MDVHQCISNCSQPLRFINLLPRIIAKKNITGFPVCIFPAKHNLFGSEVSEILRTNVQTDKQLSLYFELKISSLRVDE